MIIKKINKLKQLHQTKLWAITVNFLVILVILNILLNLVPINLDLTANKIHSLSAATKEIINQLDDIVTIKAFVSSNLPPQLIPLRETLKNLLGQYQRFGQGKIKIIWLDPQKDEKAKSEAISLGITPLQFSSLQKDQFQVVQGYFGLALFFAGEKQIIPALQEINNLEYQITATIRRLQEEKLPQIAFSTGSGEIEFSQLAKINRLLALNYQVERIDLSKNSVQFNPDLQVIIIAGPKEKFSDQAQLIIDQYLMSQKGVIFLLDKVSLSQGLVAKTTDNNLDQFLEHFGIKVNQNLVVDPSAAFASFRTEYGNFITPYPLWVKVRRENIAHDLPPTASIESVVLPWVSSLTLNKEAKPLLQSTEQASVITDFHNLTPTRDWSLLSQEKKQFVLAAIQTNGAVSFFDNKKDLKNLLQQVKIKEFKNKTETVKLIVIGDSNFIEDQTIVSYPENAQFFLNLVDYLSQDTKLINIRSKVVFSRPLKMINEKQKQTIRVANLVSGPIILTLLALGVKWRRKK